MTLQTTLDGFVGTSAPLRNRVWGAYAENNGGAGTLYELSSLATLETDVAKTFTVVSGYMDSTLESAFLTNAQAIADRGGAVNISYDLEWTFASIISGAHDAAINAHAAAFATVNGPVYLRLWAEMNLSSIKWSAAYVGSGAQASGANFAAKCAQWKTAWAHIVDLYRASAATNVRFIWNPNNEDDGGSNTLESYWPGSSYVDVLGIDCYNFGDTGFWQTFDEIFSDCYYRVTALGATQPVWIGEMGCREPSIAEIDATGSQNTVVDPAHNKGTWVTDMMNSTSYSRLQALCWFDVEKERHWQMSSSTASLNAFQSAFAGASGPTGPSGPSGSTGPTGSSDVTGPVEGGASGGSTPPADPGTNTDEPGDPVVYVSGLNAGASARITVPNIFDFHFQVWDVAVGSNRIGPEYELNNLQSRRLTLNLQGADTFTFDVPDMVTKDGRPVPNPALKVIHELDTDVFVYCDGALLFRGRIVGSADKVGSVNFTAMSYEGILDTRELHTKPFHQFAVFNPTWSPNNIIKWLIDHTENQVGMRLGITYGQWVTLPSLNVLYKTEEYTAQAVNLYVPDGAPILSQIQAICKLIDPSLEFWIDAELKANLAYTQGIDGGVILDYKGNVSDFDRSFDYKNFGNVIRATGSIPGASDGTETLTPIALPSYFAIEGKGVPISNTHTDANTPAHDGLISNGNFPPAPYLANPIGGWQKDAHNDHVYNKAGLDAYAKFQYSVSAGVDNLYSYNASIAPGQWRGLDAADGGINIGDTVGFTAQRGRVDVKNQKMRVQTMTIDIDSNGIANVQVTLNIARNRALSLKRFKDAVKALQKKK